PVSSKEDGRYSSAVARAGRTSLWGRKIPWLVLALRLIVACLAVQTGGVARDAADVVWAFALGADARHAAAVCLADRGSCHCPPGCPICHCSPGVASLPQGAPEPLVLPRVTNAGVVGLPLSDRAPPRAFLRSVYRPPRAA